MHGAGITNVMFMSSGSLLVEITGIFDGRMLPVCGYHGPLAAIFGVHHYIYHYDWKCGKRIVYDTLAENAANYYAHLKEYHH